jgi:L-amino acid N-acyltransferase YncA
MMGARVRSYLQQVRDVPVHGAWAWREDRLAGLWDTFRALTVDRLCVHQRLLLLEHGTTSATEVRTPEGIRIETFAGPDWSALAELAPPSQLRAFQAWDARGGRTCWVAWRGDQALGYAWLSDRAERDVEHVVLPLPGDAAYMRGAYVARGARNGGIGAALFRVRLRYAHERGVARVWALVGQWNGASVRVHVKIDPAVRLVGRVTQYTFPGRPITRFVPLNPPLTPRSTA